MSIPLSPFPCLFFRVNRNQESATFATLAGMVCFLSFVLWRTLGELCTRAEIGDEPRRVLAELMLQEGTHGGLVKRIGVDLT